MKVQSARRAILNERVVVNKRAGNALGAAWFPP